MQQHPEWNKMPVRPPKRMNYLLIGLILVTLISLGGNVYLALKIRTFANPTENAAAELAQLVKDVGQVLVLPQDETPTVATVTDPNKLKDQPFFANAQPGDKVLIYQNSRKAILWRPSSHKVIEVSGLNVPPPQNTGTGSLPR